MAKPKLALVTGIYPPDIGGPATYVSNIEDDLRKRANMDIIALSDLPSKKNFITIPRSTSFVSRALKIKAAIEKGSYDVIYCMDPFSMGVGCMLAKRSGRLVLRIVGDNVWEISRDILGTSVLIDAFQTMKKSPKLTFMHYLEKRVAKKADRIHTPSNHLKNMVTNWDVSPDKIIVIRNALPKKTLSGMTKEAARKKFGITRKTFITVVRLAPWKGVSVLIDVFKDRAEDLIVIGDGSMRKELEEQAKDVPNVRLVGRKPHKDVLQYCRAADGFVLNSGYEGMPFVAIEAFQEDCPVLISRACGNPEIVEDGKTGFLFEYDDPEDINKALDRLTPAMSKKIVANAHKELVKYEWNRMVDSVCAVLFED